MIPMEVWSHSMEKDIPRESGDDPMLSRFPWCSGSYSPRERG